MPHQFVSQLEYTVDFFKLLGIGFTARPPRPADHPKAQSVIIMKAFKDDKVEGHKGYMINWYFDGQGGFICLDIGT